MDVKNLCLGVLCLRDASGYEIKKAFQETYSHFQSAGFGSIYPALAQLADEGLVTCRVKKQVKRPDKNIFRITQAGRAYFRQALLGTSPAEKFRSDFLLLLVFAHLLPTARLRWILDEQEANLGRKIALLRAMQCCGEMTAGMRFTIDYGIAVNQAARNFLVNHRKQLQAGHGEEGKS